jgi:hypothetical protein
MIIDTSGFCSNELRKLGLLLNFAASTYGIDSDQLQCGVNQSSGNTWIWSEDWNYSLFIRISGNDTIEVCYSDLNNGEEYFFKAPNNILSLEAEISLIQDAIKEGDEETLADYR